MHDEHFTFETWTEDSTQFSSGEAVKYLQDFLVNIILSLEQLTNYLIILFLILNM